MKETKVFFETGYLLDSSFERVLANEKTIGKLLPKFQTAWDRLGTKFVSATLREVGREFRRSELLAYLIMHPEIFSCSHPFLININRFFNFDSASDDHAASFSELVYHELLHIYLDDNFPGIADPSTPTSSALVRRFAKEREGVLAHLHLYALQKRVFQSNGWSKLWDMVVGNATDLHSPAYQRAIEIVDDVGCEAFINELKNDPRSQKSV